MTAQALLQAGEALLLDRRLPLDEATPRHEILELGFQLFALAIGPREYLLPREFVSIGLATLGQGLLLRLLLAQ